MNWLFQLNGAETVSHAIGILALVCMAGLALGSIKLRGVGLGTAGVLFAGILAGHFFTTQTGGHSEDLTLETP
jgi:putative transport protein